MVSVRHRLSAHAWAARNRTNRGGGRLSGRKAEFKRRVAGHAQAERGYTGDDMGAKGW